MSFFATLALLLAAVNFPQNARAQGALVVTTCGTLPLAYKAGANQPLTQDVNGNACSSASGGGGGNVTIVGPLGQALSAASVPVVLPAAQITTLTPPAWSNSNQIGNTSFGATLASGAGTDGWNVTEGAKADSVCGTATGTCSEIALLKYLNNEVGGPIPAATAPYGIIGGVINGANTYNTIAASQSAQALTGGSGGATGDYLSHCTIVPATTAPGVVTILDNTTAIYSYPGGGTTALLSLIPFSIPIGAVSVSGAWKVTTGANVSVVCVGKFH
jgi:hypothetical protein